MAFDEQAATLKQQDFAALLASHHEQTARIAELTRQLEWFKQQLFGQKSERRFVGSDSHQLALGEWRSDEAPVKEITVAEHRRRARPAADEARDGEDTVRFDDTVPVEEIRLPHPPIDDEHELISEKTTYRLAQKPASYVLLKYIRPVVKRKADGALTCPPAPPSVLGKSVPDVSLVACMVIDKFRYHCVPRRHAQHPKGRRSKPCCMEDEGGPLGIGVQAQVPNHFELLGSRVRVVSVEGNGAARPRQV